MANYFLMIIKNLGSWQAKTIIILGVLVFVWLVYRWSSKALKKYLSRKAYREENVQNFFLVWRYVWSFLAFVLIVISFSGSLAALGISAAFLGMVLGWSLQAPVTGIAAWVMVVLKRPFRIGERRRQAGW